MNTGPTLTVAMSVYNNAPYLKAAVESIIAQTFTDFEFLIVNDGSSDGSGAILDSCAAKDGRIRVIHQENRGLVASLNRILDEARAPLIARMDGDDIAMPQRFERQIAFLRHSEYGVVGTWARCINGDGTPRSELCPDHPTSHEAFIKSLETGPLLCHPSVIMRRDLVLGVGGYRAQYRHCEDYDLWLRLAERTRITTMAERLLIYRHSDDQVSSRHIVEQQIGAAIAWEAHKERVAGRPDPTDELEQLPPIEQLDLVFGRAGISRAVRAKAAPEIIYSSVALRGEGYDLLLDHVREDGAKQGMWRTAARLIKLGEAKRALKLAAALTVG